MRRLAGGPARSSREAPARWGGSGAKGPAHRNVHFDQPGPWSWEEAKLNMPTTQDKPFRVPKLMVWEAWRQVKANEGAPGVDGQALEEFEADLADNLYKI